MTQVLIVDDSRTNLSLLSHLLTRVDADLEVCRIDHAQKALSWIKHNSPELIIADYSMPDINGVDFTRQCRKEPNAESVPIVMITSARRRKVCLEALRAGATDFLNSPVSEDEFVSRIGRLLQLSKRPQRRTLHSGSLPTPSQSTCQGHQFNSPDQWTKFAEVLDNIPVMVAAVSPNGECLFANAPFADFFECDPQFLIGKCVTDLPEHIHTHISGVLTTHRLTPSKKTKEFESAYVNPRGIRQIVATTAREILDEAENTVAIVMTSIDVTDHKQAEENLLYIAEHDSLTELPNRLSLRNYLKSSIRQADAHEAEFTLLFIDVDRFKNINDTLGHEFGDKLLYAIADRLDKTIAKPNFVARLGGDEFAVVIDDPGCRRAATSLAGEICACLREPIRLGGQDIRISASIGIATYPRDGRNADELLSRADLAMYRAKGDGGNAFQTACRKDHARACKNASIEADLRHAVTRDQFQLYYQPKIRLSDFKIIGAEALIRWNHPERGLIPPNDFLPLAEQNGLILQIGEWVIHRACTDAASWARQGQDHACVAVNFSPTQFAKQDVVGLTKSALAGTSLCASNLIIELTEQSLLSNTSTLIRDLKQLRDAGVRLSLDDFGTGYASLTHVQKFPITELKIDRSFIKNHTVDAGDLAIVNTVVNLGINLGLDVVAEGVETFTDVTSLKKIGCLNAQGYYFSPPVPLPEVVKLFATGFAVGGAEQGQCA